MLCKIIEEQYIGYRFAPFSIHQQTITGLHVPHVTNKAASVFDALFLSFHVKFRIPVIGNESFKADDWIKEGYVDDGRRWYAFPPNWTEEQRKAAIENAEKRE